MSFLLQWFDTRTILLCQLLFVLLMIPALLFLRRLNPRTRGIGHMAAAFLFGIPGLLLVSLRGNISQFLSIIVGNALILFAFYLIYRGIQRFLEDRSHYWFLLEISNIAGMSILAYYTYVTPDIIPRSIVAAVLLGLARLLPGITMWKHSTGRPLLRFGAIFFVSGTLFAIHRVYLLLAHGLPQNYLQPSNLQSLGLLLGFVYLVIISMFLLALITSRMRAETLTAAQVDSLTGALTRSAVDQKLIRELELSKRSGQPLSLLIIDIDHFKQFNDTAGHAAGDQALRAVADTIRLQLRTYDIFGRLGGDEMILLLPATTGEDALFVAGRLRNSIALIPPIHSGLRITVSIGVTQSVASDSPKNLLSRADSALYSVKREKRNAIGFQPAGVSRNNTDTSNPLPETLSLP